MKEYAVEYKDNDELTWVREPVPTKDEGERLAKYVVKMVGWDSSRLLVREVSEWEEV